MNYAGNKIKHISTLNKYINQSKATRYVEPFCGSASIFLNLEKKFKSYILSDNNANLVSILKTIKEVEYSDLMKLYTDAKKDFGDFKTNKESYYKMREYYNTNFYKEPYNQTGALYLYMLINSCINSFARFGPNGFNSSYGKRDFVGSLTKENYEECRSKLRHADIYCNDYKDLLDYKNHETVCMVLDPPYFERPATYNTAFDNAALSKFLSEIKELKSDVIYTDTLHGMLDWNYIELRKISNSSPSVTERTKDNKTEVMYYKINTYEN